MNRAQHEEENLLRDITMKNQKQQQYDKYFKNPKINNKNNFRKYVYVCTKGTIWKFSFLGVELINEIKNLNINMNRKK